VTRPPVQIAYGPPGRVEHGSAVARGLIAFGTALPLGVVFGMSESIAIDSGRTVASWYRVAALTLVAGLVVATVIGRAAANLGASIGRTLALTSLASAVAWLVLLNTGDPEAVDILVIVAIGASVPLLVLAGIDALTMRPSARPIDAVGQPTAAALAGVAVGAFVMFVDPTLVWSDVCAIGGAIALVGCVRRLAGPTHVHDSAGRIAPDPTEFVPPGLRLFLTATLGIAAASVVRVGPYLSTQWQAGVRYYLLTIACAGAAGVVVMIGAIWLPARSQRGAATEVDDAARLTLLAGGVLALVAASQTLPGTVTGTGVTAGVAVATMALLAASGARSDPSPRSVIVVTGATGLAAWVGAWVAWPTLLDAAGSDRVAMALLALPALAAGAMVSLRPVGENAAAAAGETAIDLSRAEALPPPFDHAAAFGSNGSNGSNGNGVTHAGSALSRTLLDARGVEFSYGAVQVLFGVDLQVRQGEVVALLGTNGAGKTTFLRTVAGLATPSSGSIRLAGGDLARFSASDRVLLGINQIAAGAAVAPDLTVAENLAMFGHSLPRSEAHAGAARAVEVFPRLGERLGQRAAALSGGERQMLALSKSLVLRPRLLVVDECTLGLAPIAVASLVPVIRQLHAEGSSILLVEQSVHLALDLATRACCMEKGRIVYESSAEELRADTGLLEAVYLEGIAAALEHRMASSDPTGTGRP